jgi:hypothetical protein
MSSYEELVKTLLKEAIEKEKLEEKLAVQVNLTGPEVGGRGDDKISGYGEDKLNDLYSNHANFTGKRKGNNKFKGIYDKIKQVANNKEDFKKLRDADIINVGIISDDNVRDKAKKEIDDLKKVVNNETSAAIDKLLEFGETIRTATQNIKNDRREEALKFVERVMLDVNTQSVEDYMQAFQSNDSLKQYYQELTAGGITNVFGQVDVLSQVDTVARFAPDAQDPEKKDFKKFTDFYVRAKKHIIDTFKNMKMLPDFPGTTAPDYSGQSGSVSEGFAILKQFGDILDKVKDGTPDTTKVLKDYLDSLNNLQKFQFLNNAAGYLSFADIARDYSGTVAGEALEKYLAIAFNMPVSGGSSGAADNVAGFIEFLGSSVKLSNAYLSAKMYADDSIYNVKQSKAGSEGMDALLKDAGEQLVYINVQKVGGVQGYNKLNVFITRVFYENNAFLVELLDSRGNAVSNPEVAAMPDDTHVRVMISDTSLKPTFEILTPIFDKAKIQNTAKLLDYVTNKTGNDLVINMKKVMANIQKLEDNMSGYRATKAGGASAKDQINNISDSYKSIYKEVQVIFGFGGAVDSDEQSSDFATGKTQTFTESKQLIDIIREMAENELKDIDFE